MSEEPPIPTAMKWRFKTIRKLLKETVAMTPNNGSSTVKPGQRIIVDLPFNFDWSFCLCLHYVLPYWFLFTTKKLH